MPLEDIVEFGAVYFNAVAIAKDYLNSQNDLKTIPSNENLARIVNSLLYDVPEEARVDALNELRRDHGALPGMINVGINEGKNGLIKTVRQNYDEVLRALSNESLLKVACRIPDSEKRFYAILTKAEELKEFGRTYDELRAEEFNALKKDYAATFNSEAWKEFIRERDATYLKRNVDLYLAYAQNKFVQQKEFIRVEGEGDNRRIVIDRDKILSYINRMVGRYNNEEKNRAYFQIGKFYASEKIAAQTSRHKEE